MPTYEEVLTLAKCLTMSDQARLLEELSINLPQPVQVEGVDEVISAEEIAESEAGLQDYLAKRDSGITAAALKQKLFGGKVG
ncbi:MAG: hypothetical protein ACFCVB_03305 [Nodosilinea sp.]